MSFRIALTADFFKENKPVYPDFDLDVIEATPGLEYTVFEEHRPDIGPDQLAGAQGVVVLTPRVTRESLAQGQDLLAVARFGVGYDGVDVEACTESDVLLCITRGAVDRPVAEATVGWMLALSHQLLSKDRLVRTGEWDRRSQFMGSELRDRTLGVIGMGGIGRELVRLVQGFGMNKPLIFDPFLDESTARELEVSPTSLEDLLAQADFVSVHCPLTDQTRNLIAAPELALMKSSAYLINTARGGIIDEDALFQVLKEGRIAGAALDCFEVEPVTEPHRFGHLDNVILAPHCIAWTGELFRDVGRMATQSLIDLAHGREPHGMVNPEVLQRPGFQEKWQRLRVTP